MTTTGETFENILELPNTENISLDNSEATLFDNDNEVVTTTGEETFENIPDQAKTENVVVILELIQSFFFS